MAKNKQDTADKPTYPLNQIYFYLTQGCNLRCRHCWLAPKFDGDGSRSATLPVEFFATAIREAKPLGLSGVKLTGGEPLLHPHILEILKLIQKEELNLTIETNGVICDSTIARKIALCRSPFVSVSLDGADPETHEWVRGVPSCYSDALKAVRHLVDAKIEVQLIMSLMRCNKDEVEAMVSLAERLGVGSVKFNIVQPTARGHKMYDAGETLTIEELVDLGRWVEDTLASSTRVRLLYSHPLAFRPFSKIFSSNNGGCGVCGILNILGVLADGSYALCGMGATVPDLVFGHAASDRLVDIWNATPTLLKLREGLPHRLEGICGRCLMKAYCLGSCIAQNYYLSKDIWAPFWYCVEAQKKGIFPKSRISPEAIERSQKRLQPPALGLGA